MSKLDLIFEKNKDLTKYSTMRLIAFGDLYTVKSISSLVNLLKEFYQDKKKYIILGMGANQLLKEKSDIPYIKLDLPFNKNYLNLSRLEYELPASITLSVLSSHAIKHGLSGWEAFTGIPATLGGAIFMNAGTALGEIGSLIKDFTLVTREGHLKKIIVDKKTFNYRKNNRLNSGDIIVAATLIHKGKDNLIPSKILNYLKKRNETQPLKEKTCGCIFENYLDKKNKLAGQSIDLLGLKGFRHKNIRISPTHANFMENLGSGTYTEVIEFILIVKKELLLQFGVDFKVEVKL